MGTEVLIDNYTPAGDMITLIICGILLLIIHKALYFSDDRKFTFLKRALHFVVIATVCNLGFYFAAKNNVSNRMILYVFRDVYHICLLCCLYCYVLYMKRMLNISGTVVAVATHATRIVFCSCLLLDVLSPYTHWGIHVDNGQWQDGVFSPFNFFYVLMLIMFLVILVFYSDRLIKSVRNCLFITEMLVVLIMLRQTYTNTNTFSAFTYVMPILVVMITLHSVPFNDKTGALDSSNFESFLKQTYQKGLTVDYMILQLNFSKVVQMPDELGKALNSFWHDSFRDAVLFDFSNHLYALAVPRDRKNGDTEAKIQYLIESKFPGFYEKYKVPYRILEIADVDFINFTSDFLGITTFLLDGMNECTMKILDEKQRDELRNYKVIKDHLDDIEKKNQLDDPRVLVYFQPIRNMKTGRYDTAEALMRMNLPELGLVMPGMFIALAEQYGHIHALSRIMLNKVCKEIKALESEGYAFERISVNFAAEEVREDVFCDEILGIISDNGVDPSKIGVELTESQNESDFLIVKEKIKVLRDAGITLYLDDVGTGYSNMDRIVQYDVDVVKFDRFFLLEAEKSMKVVKMMNHLSQAFRDLDYKLLYEGVETEAHEALCLGCGADYIQGFKYSKPVPAEEVKNYFSKAVDLINSDRDAAGSEVDFAVKRNTMLQQQYGILLTMTQIFYSMHVIDLIENTVMPYNPTEDIKVQNVVNSSVGADEMMRQIMRMCTVDEYVDDVLVFSELSTVRDRMVNKKTLSAEFVGKSIGPYVAAFYTIEVDETDRPTKVVYTTRPIEDGMML